MKQMRDTFQIHANMCLMNAKGDEKNFLHKNFSFLLIKRSQEGGGVRQNLRNLRDIAH